MISSIANLENEWRQSIADLGTDVEPVDIEIKIQMHEACKRFRAAVLSRNDPPVRITGNSFWDLPERNRFDILAHDIGQVVSRLKLCIGLSYLYLPLLAPTKPPPYAPGFPDRMFWHEVDSGIRLISSGWDRIALLLDLVLSLGKRQYCNISKVLHELGGQACSRSDPYLAIREYISGDFDRIEGGRGAGARHESTHLLTMSTRMFMETIEGYVDVAPHVPHAPSETHQNLVLHFNHYVAGIDNALDLIEVYYQQSPS